MWLLLFFLLCHYMSTDTKVINITEERVFDNLIKENDKKVIVEFSANWCGACTQVKKPFEEVAAESEFDTITFVCINIDQAPTICKKYQIDGIPTFLYLENGKQKEKDIGVQDLRAFKDHLRGILRKNFASHKPQSLPRVTLLPSDHSSMQKKNQVAYTDIIISINNAATTIMTSIKEWFDC